MLDSGDTSNPYFIQQDFELLVNVHGSTDQWVGLAAGNASLPADLPKGALQSGWSSLAARGRPTFVCRIARGQLDPSVAPVGAIGVSGSVSFADWPGVGHCRIVYNGTGYYVASGYEVLVVR